MRRSPNFVARRILDRVVLLPLKPGQEGLWLFELNETSEYLWNQMLDEFNEQTLASKLVLEYSINDDQAKADVECFLEELLEIGAVE